MQPHVTTKRCIRCNEIKPLSEFFRRPNSTELRGHCKACHHKGRSPEKYTVWHNVKARIFGRKVKPYPSMDELRTLGDPSKCYLCGESLTWETAEIDHVIPLSKGGTSEIGNLKWVHRDCNSIKKDMTLAELRDCLIKLMQYQENWPDA